MSKSIAKPNHIWVWTQKAGSPATLGNERLGMYAPKLWVEKGHVEEMINE